MSETTIACPEHLNITMVESFKAQLLAALEESGSVVVDVSPVTKVDTTGVQLLLAFRLDMQRHHAEVFYSGESEPLNNTLSMLGLSEQFPFKKI